VAQACLAQERHSNPADRSSHLRWTDLLKEMVLVIKNTFLEFQEEDLETQRHKRSSSLPPGNDSRWESAGFDMASESHDGLPICSPEVAKQRGAWQKASSTKNPIRPYKARRDKFRQFVEKLKQQLLRDPDDFSLDKITVPKNILWNERTHLKVVKLLADFQKEHIDCHLQTPCHFQ